MTLSGTATNAQLGSYPISGSGTVTQTIGTSTQPNMDGLGGTVTAIKVTRVYSFTALVHGISIPLAFTDVAYYDPTSYAYMGGTFTDSTLVTTTNVLLTGWVPPPDTLTCCSSGTSFYKTAANSSSGPTTHDYSLSVTADTANSVFVNLTDSASVGASRKYRLDSTNTLTPVTENINVVAYVLMSNGYTYPFTASVTFNY